MKVAAVFAAATVAELVLAVLVGRCIATPDEGEQ